MNPADSTVLVTGAAKRVGAEFARAFAAAGAHVFIHCNTSRKEAEALADELGGEAAGHSVVCCDLSKPENIPALFSDLPRDLSILINSASIFNRQDIGNEPLSSAKHQFDVNFWGPVELMRHFYAHSTPSELAVVNILDQSIVKTPHDSFSYALSKKALAEATRAAALHYAPRMRVNGLAPGPVVAPPGRAPRRRAATWTARPRARPGNRGDLSSACMMLATNSSITGATLFVDCGQSLT